MRICKCGTIETEENPFYNRTSCCPACYNAKKKASNKAYRSRPGIKEHYNKRERDSRKDPLYRASWIVKDSKKSDKRSGLENNLTVEEVNRIISNSCSYCGEDKLKITLDRKDNSIGHTINNVVPCCIRCNMIRRNMPYAAWTHIARAVREAREMSLFGNWTCEIH